MRLSFSKSKNSTSLYVIRSTYENGVRSSKIVEKLGTLEELSSKLEGQDPIEWAKRHVEELNRQEKENRREVAVRYSPTKLIDKGLSRSFNGGYLFFEKIYRELGINGVCKDIAKKHNLSFDLSSLLSRFVYASIFSPSVSYGACGLLKASVQRHDAEDKNLRKALEIVAKEADSIQRAIYKNRVAVLGRSAGMIFYKGGTPEFEDLWESDVNSFGQMMISMGEDGHKAHATVCLIAQTICSFFEKRLKGKYNYLEIIRNLREMNFFEIRGEGYVPTYIRTDFTDDLHEAFGFRTDYQIVSAKEMERIFKKISS